MIRISILSVSIFISSISVAQSLTRVEIGASSSPENSDIKIELVARKQHYNSNPKAESDVFDDAISSPKSVVFTPDGTKFYVHSLEGYTTSAYNAKTFEKIKDIKHTFRNGNAQLFKGGEVTVFDYEYKPEFDDNGKPKERDYNIFSGKPVESCISHDGKYLWVTYYRRSFDQNAESPSAVAIIDTEKDEIVRVMPTGPLPKMIACSPDNKFIAVTHWGDNTVGIIDVSGDNVMDFNYVKHCIVDHRAELNFDSEEHVDRDNNCGNCLRGTVFTPDNNYLIVGKMGGSGGMMIFDTHDWSSLGTVKGMEINLRHIVIHEDQLYLSTNKTGCVQKCNWKDVVKFRIENEGRSVYFKEWETAKVGAGARTISVSNDGAYVFSAVNNECKVKAVRTSDMQVIATIDADSYPVGMALSPDEKHLIVTAQGKGNKGGNSVMIYEITRKQ